MPLTEADIEFIALGWFAECGYAVVHGPDIAPDMEGAERTSYEEVVLVGRLRSALLRLNPELSAEDLDETVRKVLRSDTPGLVQSNRRFHAMLRDGVVIERKRDASARASTCCVLGLRAEVDPVRQQGVVASWRCGVDA
jgi:type I restriction enzyme R subunit